MEHSTAALRFINENDIEHFSASLTETPIHENAFSITEEEKINIITKHFSGIMHALGLDLSDESLKDTPRRVAKMYVQEIFGGLNPVNKPAATIFKNTFGYKGILVEKNINLYSTCEHHFVPIIGKGHVAYISSGSVIGLSKINRLVHYYASRPQVQERLTRQVADGLKEALSTNDVAVIIDAAHLCVASRGIKDTSSSTITAHYSGQFKNEDVKKEFLDLLHLSK